MTATIAFSNLTKRYGDVTAVRDLTFTCNAGRITGLLGPNGAGKSTTMRALVGLVRPTSGAALILGSPYEELADARHRVGVMIDGVGPLAHLPGRTELRVWARSLGIPEVRGEEVLRDVGLAEAASRRIATYSQGMRQRHALATALLADPEILVLDEPTNGLDPDGIRATRSLLRRLADEGRTVLVSSHALSELERYVDDVVIIQQTVRFAGPLSDLHVGAGAGLEERFFELVDAAEQER